MAISDAAAKVLTLTAALISINCLPAQADQASAEAKYKARDYQGALNEFKAVYARDPKNSLARYYMALCNQCLARVDEAKKDYKWVVENGAPNLRPQAQTGLSQLEKVNVRTGGSASSVSTTTTTTPAATADSTKPSNDLIDRSGKDKMAKDAAGKTAAGDKAASATKTATATPAAGNVDKVLNFYSDSSRNSQLMEGAWDEIKTKYAKIGFQKINAGDPLCDKYGVTEFPTVIVIDKNGKALNTQSGAQSVDGMAAMIDGANGKK